MTTNKTHKNTGLKNTDPTKQEMISFLLADPSIHGMVLEDRFSVAAAVEIAIYWYALLNHAGQTSNLYAALCDSPYKPGILMKNERDEQDPLVSVFYKRLCKEYD